MFDFLPAEKRNVLLEYPFARAFAEGKLSVDRFLDNIHSFESELKSRGFSDADLKALASVQQKGKDGMEILRRYGFPIDRYPKLASFLAAHPDDLEEMAKAAGTNAWTLFRFGLPAVKDLINEKTWPGMVEMAKAAGTNAGELFGYGLPAVKDLINEKTWPGMVEMAKAAGPKANYLFRYGLSRMIRFIESYDDFVFVKSRFLKLLELCKGAEEEYFASFGGLYNLFDRFGLGFLDSFVMPVTKSQKVGAILVFWSCGKIFDACGVAGEKDVDFLRFICTKYLTKADVILRDIILEGLQEELIPQPISKEAEIIKAFLENAPAYIIDIYPAFKSIYLSEASDKDMKVGELFKDIKKLKKELFEGELSKEYDDEIFFSVLYYVFACHDITVPKESYIQVYNDRQDRESDVPAKFRKPLKVKVSKGGHVLKDSSNPVNEEAWDLLIRVAREVKEKKDFDAAQFGFGLLAAYQDKTLHGKRERFIRGIYQFSFNHGWSLPDFRLDYEVLAKYKEFVGDRIVNDLIYGILKEALSSNPALFFQHQNAVLGKKVDFAGLAKQIAGIARSPMPPEKKEDTIGKVLRQNGFHTEKVSEILAMDAAHIKDWLASQQPNVVEKGLVAKMFQALYGDEYELMKKEIVKYEFRPEGRGKGKEYFFLLSKRRVHSVAMFNMGVCVAPDDKLWNSPDMWQLIIFDEKHDAHGGAILRTIEEDGKKYLIASVQPSQSILNEVSPAQLFDKIMQFCRIIARTLKYQNVLIPTSSAIHSNRGSIQQVIADKYGKSTPLKLKEKYEFSYSLHNYPYQEFYIAY
jgi:hypothetical protein